MKKYCKKIWSVLILVFLICSCKTEEEPADSSQSEILAFLMQKLEFYDSKKINASTNAMLKIAGVFAIIALVSAT